MRQTILNRLLPPAVFAVLFGSAAIAQGTGQGYVGGQLGLAAPDGYTAGITGTAGAGSADHDLGNGGSIGLVIGRQFGNSWRGEVELSYQKSDAESARIVTDAPSDQTTQTSGSISSTQIVFNAWYDVPTSRNWTPYLGGGLGLARVDGDVQSAAGTFLDDSDSGYLGQLGFGVQIPVGGTGSVDVGYRFKSIRDADLDYAASGLSGSDGKYDNHVLSLGYNLNF